METTSVMIPVGSDEREADLAMPDDPGAVVLFARDSGSVRRDDRDRIVAHTLHQAGIGTLGLDLVAPYETQARGNLPEVPVLAERLEQATGWLRDRQETRGLPIGYFGEGAGTAAALWAATDVHVGAVVSLSGQPELANERLGDVTAPVLLIVGGRDEAALDGHREAKRLLGGSGNLTVVPEAGGLFEEAGPLGDAAELARDWFKRYLTPKAS